MDVNQAAMLMVLVGAMSNVALAVIYTRRQPKRVDMSEQS